MNRKLHNTTSALMVLATLLLLALIAQASSNSAIDAGTDAPAAASATASTDLSTRALGGRAGRVRHSVALPFFSFAPRG
jgi:RNA 3'-terminal phosphate cyclase